MLSAEFCVLDSRGAGNTADDAGPPHHSTFARNAFQMVQFIPLIIVPQIFISGVLWPIEQMPTWLQLLAHIMPLTYAIQGLRDILLSGKSLADVWGSWAS